MRLINRKPKSRISFILIVIAVTITSFLCSCSQNETDRLDLYKSYNNFTVTLEPVEGYATYVQDVLLENDTMCIVTQSFSLDDVDSLCALHIYDSDGVKINSFRLPENINLNCFGSVIDGEYILATYDNSLIFVDIVTGEIKKEMFFDYSIYGTSACDDGYIIYKDRTIDKYNLNDAYISSIDCSSLYYYYGSHPFFEINGKSYIVGYNKNFSPTYYEVDFDSGTCNEVISLENVSNLWCDSYGQYLFDDNFEYEIDLDEMCLIQLYSLNYTDIKPERFTLMQDNRFVFDEEHFADVYEYTNDVIDINFYYYDPSIDMSSRELITIGGYDVNTDLAIRNAVYQFNTSQDEYRAVIEDYTRMFGWDDAVSAQIRHAELISYFNNGNAPDIYYGNSFDYDYMGRNNMVIDLAPYVNDTGILSEASDSINNLYGETIYSVFPAYSMAGYFSLKDEFPENSLSLDELVLYSEERNMPPIDRITSVNIADVLLRYSLRQSLNNENEHVYTIDELESVIDFSLDNGIASVSNNMCVYGTYDVVAGVCPIAFANVSCVEDVYSMNEYDGGRFSFVGYPNVHGSTHVINPIGRVAVSSSGENIEQCIDLISILFGNETQTLLGLNRSIPVNQRILEECTYSDKYVTSEIIDDFFEMIDSVDTIAELDWGVYNIIAEEVESYYLNNKSPEEIAVSLQNRLDLYISENY